MITSLALLALTMGPPAALFLWLLSKCPPRTREEWVRDQLAHGQPDSILEPPYTPPRRPTQAERVEYAKRLADGYRQLEAKRAALRELQQEGKRAKEAADQEFQ